jgi:hypothetical protein
MDTLPSEAIHLILAHLDVLESLSCRRVCRDWMVRLTGCALFEYSCPPMQPYIYRLIQGIHLSGTRQQPYQQHSAVARKLENEVDNNDDTQQVDCRKRTRGHLPEPQVLLVKSTTTEDKNSSAISLSPVLEFLPSHRVPATAFRLEEPFMSSSCTTLHQRPANDNEDDLSSSTGKRLDWTCINLSESTIILPDHHPRRLEAELVRTKSRRLQNVLLRVDVSSLTKLERLSVRGCGNLQRLLLPTCLQALDASSCARLVSIGMPSMWVPPAATALVVDVAGDGTGAGDGDGVSDGCREQSQQRQQQREQHSAIAGQPPPQLVALNLSGSRNLQTLFYTLPSLSHGAPHLLKHLKELNASSTLKVGSRSKATTTTTTTLATPSILGAILRHTVQLESLSLRYIATDEMLEHLAQSQSATSSGTLQWIDISFSPTVQDASVYGLVHAAPRLERLNLRGCTSVSGTCYNQVPIVLMERASHRPLIPPLPLGTNETDPALQPQGVGKPTPPWSSPVAASLSRRKGDNMFYFTANHPKPRRPTNRKKQV